MHLRALHYGSGDKPDEVAWDEALARSQEKSEGAWWFAILNEDPTAVSHILTETFGFHPVAVDEATSDDSRPGLKEFDDHLFILTPCMAGAENGLELFVNVALFVRGKVLVSVTPRSAPCLSRRMERLAQPKNQHGRIGFLIYSIIDSIVDDFFPLLDSLEDKIDEVADAIMQGSTTQLRELMMLKRRMLEVRRRIGPLRDLLNSMLSRDPEFITSGLAPYFHDLFDNALRLTELIDTNRDGLTGLADIHLSTVSNRLNEVMKKMTVIATVMMWASLVAGIYGMNVQIPEYHWSFGYPWALGLMVAGALAILAMFKKQNWL